MYVLHAKLQQDNKISKWQERAQLGIYLGMLQAHASSVALIPNLHMGLISPQFHVQFDDTFSTLSEVRADATYTQKAHWIIETHFSTPSSLKNNNSAHIYSSQTHLDMESKIANEMNPMNSINEGHSTSFQERDTVNNTPFTSPPEQVEESPWAKSIPRNSMRVKRQLLFGNPKEDGNHPKGAREYCQQ